MSNGDKSIAPRDESSAPAQENLGGVFRLDALSPGGPTANEAFTPTRGKLSTQTLLLGVLLLAGVGIVYSMRLLGVGSIRNLASATMPDYDISKTGVNKTVEHKRALEALSASEIKKQVSPEDVQKNPFKMADSLMKDTAGNSDDPDERAKQTADRVKKDTESRRARIMDRLSKIKVNSILGGPKPVARIDGEFVRVGEMVDEMFTLKAVEGRTLTLECDGKTYTLTMDEDLNENKKPKKKK